MPWYEAPEGWDAISEEFVIFHKQGQPEIEVILWGHQIRLIIRAKAFTTEQIIARFTLKNA